MKDKLKVAYIMDTFSEANFGPEFTGVPLFPHNYNLTLQRHKDIDLVLIESAWRGNNRKWRLVIEPTNRWVVQAIRNIVSVCKKRGIPAVFWNKEDPVHFKHFLPVARNFSVIATTDVNSVSKYRQVLGNSVKVFVLPFAAQPTHQYPNDLLGRNKRPCFAGTYWSVQHKHRQTQMKIVLNPCVKYGLHIYDRRKAGGAGSAFPPSLNKCVVGGLPFLKLLHKYREYRFFVNVDIVTNSPTMFSRRVFELLACGTPVLGSYSLGVASTFKDIVQVSRSVAHTDQIANDLLTDDDLWNELSLGGIKEVYSKHTYAHRLRTICEQVGLPIATHTKERLQLYDLVSQATTIKDAMGFLV